MATSDLSTSVAASATAPALPSADTALGRQLLAEQIIGFRIMKQTEVAPGWWGQPVEVGETGSSTVAYEFCTKQNKVTMNLNRPKMIQYFAEPIYAERASSVPVDSDPAPGDILMAAREADHLAHCGPCRERAAASAAALAENGESMRRRDRIQLGLHIAPTLRGW